ncbi:thioredoxin family protein [Myroides sp. LJL119]
MKYIDPTIIGKSLTYLDFREFVTNALQNNPEALQLSEDYLQYAILNQSRLHRLDKTLVLDSAAKQALESLEKEYIWLVITESWCGDAAQSVPMLNKMAECSSKIQMRVVFRDQNLELMDAFLTNGGRAIPKMLILDQQTNQVLATWGPRPVGAQNFVDQYKLEHGGFDMQGANDLQLWYTKDKGKQVELEVVEIMKSLENL